MGYFQHKFGLRSYTEAEIDGQPGSDEQSADYTEDTSSGGNEAQPDEATGGEETTDYTEQPEEGGDQSPADETPVDGGGEETTDYTEMGGDEEGEAPSGGGSEAPPPEDNKPVDELKQQEEEMYGLSTDKLELRHKELKNQYLAMYDTVVNIIDRIGSSSVQEEDIGAIEYVSETLSKFRSMLTDYIDRVYALNSYIENTVNYNRFLAVLGGVNKILEELDKKQNK